MLFLNTTKIQHFVQNEQSEYNSCHYPNQVCWFPKAPPYAAMEIKNFLNYVRAHTTGEKHAVDFCLARKSGIGDVLMLVPVVRYLQQHYGLSIALVSQYSRLVSKLGVIAYSAIPPKTGGDYPLSFSLENIFERDRFDNRFQGRHRVNIAFDVLGVPRPAPEEVDWHWDSSWFPQLDIEDKRYIVVNVKGSSARNSLSDDNIWELLKSLDEVGIPTKVNHPVKFNSSYVKEWAGSPVELFSLIAGAECLITTNTSTFWMSHFTKTPTVLVISTPKHKYVPTLHPLYPEGVKTIFAGKYLNCDGCWETGEFCSSEFLCLSRKEIISEIVEAAKSFWEACVIWQ